MKRFAFIMTLAFISATAFANLNGNGYYRVRNYGSGRWANVIDNQGEIDMTATTADLHSMQLNLDTEEIITDPGSILYISNEGGRKYNVAAQGTSIEAIAGYDIYIGEYGTVGDQSIYVFYGTYKGATKYIGDKNMVTTDQFGYATIDDVTNKNYQRWYILPVSVESSNYFAAVPTLNVGGKLYRTLFTSFPYQTYSPGVKAYYINRVGDGMAEMIEIEDGVVPENSPVIIECAGESAADNKLALYSSYASLPANSLSGVYFDYYYSKNLNNRVLYDPATMRVLGTCSDGSLGFITSSDLESIPANSAYLKVPEGSPAEFRCVSSEEYTADVSTISADGNTLQYQNGIIYSGKTAQISVINLDGQTVAKAVGSSLDVSNLPKGIYIAKTSDKTIKFAVN